MRIGTRASALALAQAELVVGALKEGEVVPILTSGDRGAEAADKSRWVAELEQALMRGDIDLAVHSAKDLPGELAEGSSLVGAPRRAAAEDALCGARALEELAPGARVGTSSVRRAAQLRAAREDLQVVPISGNVDTRLRKLASADGGELAAIVLARAGLQRLGREREIGAVLDPERFVPAPGQGALALQARTADARVKRAVAAISDEDSLACLLAERSLARELSASCHTPLGAHAERAHGQPGRMRMRAWVGLPDGSVWIGDELLGDGAQPQELGRDIAARLKLAGGEEILRRAEEMASVGNA